MSVELLQTTSTTLLPDLKDWVYIIITVGGLIFTFGRMTAKLNGLGERVNTINTSCTQIGVRQEELSREQESSRADRARIHERLGSVEKQGESLRDTLTDVKVDIIAHIDEVKRVMMESDGRIRERVVRLETVSEIERKIGRPLTELTGD